MKWLKLHFSIKAVTNLSARHDCKKITYAVAKNGCQLTFNDILIKILNGYKQKFKKSIMILVDKEFFNNIYFFIFYIAPLDTVYLRVLKE